MPGSQFVIFILHLSGHLFKLFYGSGSMWAFISIFNHYLTSAWHGNYTDGSPVVMSVAPHISSCSQTGLTSSQQFVHTYSLLRSAVVGGLIWTISEKFKLWQFYCFRRLSLIFCFQRISKALAWCSPQWSFSPVISVQMLCQGGFVKKKNWYQIV